MLQYIKDMPENVVGIHAIGEVTKDDIDKVLLPRLDELAEKQGKINYLLVLETDASNFTLAAWWSDLVAGLKHFTHWNKIAIVSDQKGVEWFTNMFTHFIPGKSKGFSLHELDMAISWIVNEDSKIK